MQWANERVDWGDGNSSNKYWAISFAASCNRFELLHPKEFNLTALSMLVSILLISDSVAQSPGFLVTRLNSSPPVARSMIM